MIVTMPPLQAQYLQVPKTLSGRNARARSKSRQKDAHAPREVTSPTEVIVSPIKLSFRPRSPPSAPAALKPYQTPSAKPTQPGKTSAKSPPAAKAVLRPPHASDEAAASPAKPETAPVLSPPPTPRRDVEDLHGELYGIERCVTPPAEPSLRQRLIGAWKLESYIAYPTPSSAVQRPTYPMTKTVTGFIMYTPDGYMSAQMVIPGQRSFKRGEGEEAQWAEAGKRCFAYCGPYYITNEGSGREEVLRHTFQCCSLPGWVGDVQVRTHRFEEDGQVLVLGSEEPTEIKGDKRNPVLRWRRARDNLSGSPPPPMPQIKVSGPGEL